MKYLSVFFLIATMSACGQSQDSDRFSLPQGNAENGRMVFYELNCIRCHVLHGTEFNGDQERLLDNGGIAVSLGGETTRVKSYTDLVSSIINPSHRIANDNPAYVTPDGQSKMAYYNEVMTVAELIDLVTFLKSQYQLSDYPATIYPYYYYPG